MLTYSLRNALLLSLLSTSFVIWGITVYFSYHKARHEVTELFQAELSQSAHILLAMVNSTINDGAIPGHWNFPQGLETFTNYLPDHPYEGKLVFQLWDPAGNLLLHTSSAPLYPISDKTRGFSQTTLNNRLWHVYSVQDQHAHLTLHVGQRDDIYQKLANDITGQLMKQFLFGPPVMALVIWLLVGRSMLPLRRLAEDVKRREANLLTPLTPRKLPSEVAPLVDALNNLLQRLRQAFENERSFAGDASHELRTPLAGLKTQSQVALRATDPGIRNQALKNIGLSVDRMAHMVQQLLTLARVDPDAGLTETENVSLESVVVSVITELEYKASQKHTELRLAVSNSIPGIRGNTALLETMIYNLLDNAIRYTPEGSKIQVTLTCNTDSIKVNLDDDGHGIPEEERSKVLQRFYRGRSNHADQEGSGLGFSIAMRIAVLHGADFTLGCSPQGGLRVSVIFPKP